MMTFKKVLDIFSDYLAIDTEIEIVLTKRGYLRIVWAGNYPYCDDTHLFQTPEEMFDRLLDDCQSYHEATMTRGRRNLTSEDINRAKELCQPYIEKRKEAEV